MRRVGLIWGRYGSSGDYGISVKLSLDISYFMTVLEAYSQAKLALLKSGVEPPEAHVTARILLDALSGTPHAHLTRAEVELLTEQQKRFDTALSELESGRPLPYVLGQCDFFDLTFACDERALIPRPETELLVELALEKLKSQSVNSCRVVDLGTGTGCIAISIAKNFPDAQVCATDASPAALSLARENAMALGVSERVQFLPGVIGDWAAPLSEHSSEFAIIVSNPPYIAPRDIEELQIQVREFEPRSALDGGEDGLDCYRELATQCGKLLSPDGVLACELGAGQFEDVRAIFEAESWRVEKAIYDFAGIARVLVAQFKP